MSKLESVAKTFEQEKNFQIEFKLIEFDESTYFVPRYAMHRPAVRNILNGKLYEPRTHAFVKHLCGSMSGSIVHAGTFFGDMLPNFSKFVDGKVYAFEPVLENYILARLSVEKNQLSNVLLFNSALGEKVENLTINTSAGEGLHAGGGSKIADHGKICTSISIDNLHLSNLILIQLDVEGFELNALRGAQQTIEILKPVIAIEDNKRNCNSYLIDLGYEKIGKIPGLTIWVDRNNEKSKAIVNDFFTTL